MSILVGFVLISFLFCAAEATRKDSAQMVDALHHFLIGRLLKEEADVDAEEIGRWNEGRAGDHHALDRVFHRRVEEGDIVFHNPTQEEEEDDDDDEGEKRRRRRKRRPAMTWQGGVVYFVIDDSISGDRLKTLLWAMKDLEDAINNFDESHAHHDDNDVHHDDHKDDNDAYNDGSHAHTHESHDKDESHAPFASKNKKKCLGFLPINNDVTGASFPRNYVFVRESRLGCSSSVGVQKGIQFVNLGPKCWQPGKIQHELLHTLGLWHEQSRNDRDAFVAVQWENVEEEKRHDFLVYTDAKEDHQDLPYDYGSIMHYGPYYFAKDRRFPTLIPRRAGVEIGQRRAPSKTDIEKVRLLYGCKDKTKS